MKQIFQDILKPEEAALGFTPGEPDDDTFLLESQKSYPVDIPDYEQNETVIADTPIPDKPFEQPIYEVPEEGSVWDFFDEEKPEEVEDNSADDNTDDASEAIAEEDDDMLGNASEDDTVDDDMFGDTTESDEQQEERVAAQPDENEEYLYASDVEIAEEEIQPASNEPEIDEIPDLESMDSEIGEQTDDFAAVEAEPAATAEIDSSDSEIDEQTDDFAAVEAEPEDTAAIDDIALDDDFLKSLKSELDNKPRKEKAKETATTSKSDDKPLFVATDKKGGDETFVDISALNFDKPSNVNDIDEGENSDDSADKSKDNELPNNRADKKSKDDKSREEKENKKGIFIFPWTNLAVAAASFILLFVVGTGGYYAWNKYALPMFGDKDNQELVSQNVEDNAQNEESIAEEKSELIADTAQQESIAEDTAQQKAEVTPAEVKPVVPKPAARNEAARLSKQTPPPTKPKTVQPTKPAPQPKEQPKPVESIAATTPTKQEITPTKQPEQEIYTVQVYATPSAEDASMWLRQLVERNIEGGYISPQTIRDKTWYRVRFGYFTSRDEARAAASKYGFSRSWIDRIK